jgi:hypothetical protein
MQKFPCKHREIRSDGTVKQCPEEVEYEDIQVVLHNRPLARRSKKKTVYLECDAGHTYPYEISDSEE